MRSVRGRVLLRRELGCKGSEEGRTAVAVEDALDGLEVSGHFLARLKRAMG